MSNAKKAMTVAALAVLLAAAPAARGQVLAVDHLKCYKVKDAAKFLAEVDLEALQDQFGLENCKLKGKAKLFCVPVAKTVKSFVDKTKPPLKPYQFAGQNLTDDRLCYKIKCQPPVATPELEVTDQFGTRNVRKFKAFMVCTPAFKGAPPTTTTTTTLPPTTTTTLP
ncbi:MAG: hypothetical protein D6815_07085, partial [Candidatus Dadabacteria bacterium]